MLGVRAMMGAGTHVPYISGFSNRMLVNIDHTKVDDTLTHFPVPVILNGTDHGDIFDELRLQDVDDDFTGTDGDTPDTDLWSITNSSAAGTAQINNNKLRITIPDTANDENIIVTSKFKLSGDFDIQIDYDQISNNQPSSSGSYPSRLLLYTDDGNYFFSGTRYLSTDSRELLMQSTATAADTISNIITGKLRFVRSGSTITGYVWSGSQWEWDGNTSGKAFSDSDSSDIEIAIRVDADFASGATTDFDNFQVDSGTIVWPENTNPDRKKIAFTKSDGETQLFGEIEQWDQTNEKAVIWVSKSDWEIDADADTQFYMYYDSTADDNHYIGDTDEEVSTTDATEFDDDFTGNDGDAPDSELWTVETTNGTAEIDNNKLYFSVSSNTTDDRVVSKFKLSGDFDIQADYSDLVGFTSTYKFLRLCVFKNLSSYDDQATMNRAYIISNSLYDSFIKSNNTTVDQDSINTADTSGKLRIVRSGSDVTCYYWSGSSWVSMSYYSSWTTDDVYVAFRFYSNPSGTLSACIDNFQINSGTIKYTPAERVWDENFAAVYHMAQDPSGTAPQLLDSTSNDNDGTSSGSMTSADLVDGGVGKALDFDGVNDAITIPGSVEFDLDSSHSWAAWVKIDNVSTDQYILTIRDVNYNGGSAGENSYFLACVNSKLRATIESDDTFFNRETTNTLSNSVWYRVFAKNYSNVLELFLNGVSQGTTTITDTTIYASTMMDLYFGAYHNGGGTFSYYNNGLLDEINISKNSRSDAWVKADYYAQTDALLLTELTLPSRLPTLSNRAPTRVGKSRAMINGSVDGMGYTDHIILSVEYGETTSYGLESDLQNVWSVKDVFIGLNNLNANTTYHYRWKATDGVGTWYSVDGTFDTLASNVASGQLTINGTGTFSVTGLDFEPDLILFQTIAKSVPESTDAYYSFGASNGDDEFTIGVQMSQDVSPTVTSRWYSESYIGVCVLNNSTIYYKIALNSINSDGFTVQSSDYPDSNDRTLHWVAIGGLENTKISSFDSQTTIGSKDITDIGFRPDCLINASGIWDTADDIRAGAILSLGICDSELNQYCNSLISSNSQTVSQASRISFDEYIYGWCTGGSTEAIQAKERIESFLYNGFRVKCDDADSASRKIFSIAIKGLDTNVSHTIERTTVGTTQVSNIGFHLDGLFILNCGLESFDSILGNASAGFGFGHSTDSTDQLSVNIFDRNGEDPTQTRRGQYTGYVNSYYGIDSVLGSILFSRSSLSAIDSDSFTLNFDTVDSYERYIPYLAFKEKAIENDKLLIESGQVEIDSTSAVSVTGLGFKPELILFQYVSLAASTGSATQVNYSFGAIDRHNNKFCTAIFSKDNTSTPEAIRWFSQSYIAGKIVTGSVVDHRIALNSINSDGFTVQSSDYPDSVMRQLTFTAFGNLEDVKSFSFERPTDTTEVAFSVTDFEPDGLLINTTHNDSIDAVQIHAMMTIGFCDSDLNQSGVTSFSSNNTAQEAHRISSDSYIYNSIITSQDITNKGKITEYTSDGFKFKLDLSSGSSLEIFGVAVKGINTKVDSFTELTVIGDKTISDVGFELEGLLTLIGGNPTNDVGGVNAVIGMGFANGITYGEQGLILVRDTDSSSPTDANRTQRIGANYSFLAGSAVTSVIASLKEITSTGFVENFSTVDSSVRYVPYLAFKKHDSPTTGPPLISLDSTTNIVSNGFRVNCQIEYMSFETSLSVSVEYGGVSSFESETTAQVITSAQSLYVDITGLNAGEQYFFRVKVVGEDSTYYSNVGVAYTSE